MSDLSLLDLTLENIWAPVRDYAFMRRALAACLILSLGLPPLGIFLNLRRMTLVGDAVSHAILPGIALAFLLAGLNLWGMAAGGMATGVLVALAAIWLSRRTQLSEDAAFTLVYLISLACGILLIARTGSSIDLVHILFGNILGIDNANLGLIAGMACVTLLVLAALYRGLVIDCFDGGFFAATGRARLTGPLFFLLLVVNLVAAFQALGTLMALGLMILPALAAKFWSRRIDRLFPIAIGIAALSAIIGLLLSYYAQLPSGPAIVLVAGVAALGSALVGRHGSALAQRRA